MPGSMPLKRGSAPVTKKVTKPQASKKPSRAEALKAIEKVAKKEMS